MSLVLQVSGGAGWDVETMSAIVKQAMSWTIPVGVFLATTFLSAKLAIEYFRHSGGAANGNDETVLWDWNEIIRVLFIIIVLGSFQPLAEGVTGAIRGINDITQPSSEAHTEMRKAANVHYLSTRAKIMRVKIDFLEEKFNSESSPELSKAIQHAVYRQEMERLNGTIYGSDDSKSDVLDSFQDNLGGTNGMGSMIETGFTMGITGLISMVASVIKWVIGTFVKMIFQIGLVFGPLSLAFGVLKKDMPMRYLMSMLNLGFVFTTLNILDMLTTHFIMYSMAEPNAKMALAFNLAIIGAYLSAFKITNLFIGETGMQSIMQKGFGFAGGLIGGMVMGGSMAAGGGAAGSAVGSAGRAVKNTTRERLD